MKKTKISILGLAIALVGTIMILLPVKCSNAASTRITLEEDGDYSYSYETTNDPNSPLYHNNVEAAIIIGKIPVNDEVINDATKYHLDNLSIDFTTESQGNQGIIFGFGNDEEIEVGQIYSLSEYEDISCTECTRLYEVGDFSMSNFDGSHTQDISPVKNSMGYFNYMYLVYTAYCCFNNVGTVDINLSFDNLYITNDIELPDPLNDQTLLQSDIDDDNYRMLNFTSSTVEFVENDGTFYDWNQDDNARYITKYLSEDTANDYFAESFTQSSLGFDINYYWNNKNNRLYVEWESSGRFYYDSFDWKIYMSPRTVDGVNRQNGIEYELINNSTDDISVVEAFDYNPKNVGSLAYGQNYTLNITLPIRLKTAYTTEETNPDDDSSTIAYQNMYYGMIKYSETFSTDEGDTTAPYISSGGGLGSSNESPYEISCNNHIIPSDLQTYFVNNSIDYVTEASSYTIATIYNDYEANWNTPGNYTIKLQATDSWGNVGNEVTFYIKVVDSIAPSFEGTFIYTTSSSEPISLSTIKEAISCSDNIDGEIPHSSWTITDNYTSNSAIAGTYIINFKATDEAGNEASQNVSITVTDTTAPVINNTTGYSVTDYDNPFSLNTIKSWFSATDNTDGTITNQIRFETDYPEDTAELEIKSYTFNISVTDNAGNTSNMTLIMYVMDLTAPTITSSNVNTNTGSLISYDDILEGITAVDNIPTAPTVKSQNWGGYNEDTSTPGTYTATITYQDASGNEAATTFNIIVTDGIAPVLTVQDINGTTTTLVGANYIRSIFTAIDETDGDVSSTIIINFGNYIDRYNIAGTYPCTASAKDAAGNTSTKNFNIIAIDNTLPIIYANDMITFSESITLSRQNLIAFLFQITGLDAETVADVQLTTTYFETPSTVGNYELAAKITLKDSSVIDKVFTLNVVSEEEFKDASKDDNNKPWYRKALDAICNFFKAIGRFFKKLGKMILKPIKAIGRFFKKLF